jgi:hypothetical protein
MEARGRHWLRAKYGPMVKHTGQQALNTWQAGDQATACDWELVDASPIHRPVFCISGSLASRATACLARNPRLSEPHRPGLPWEFRWHCTSSRRRLRMRWCGNNDAHTWPQLWTAIRNLECSVVGWLSYLTGRT